MKKLIILAAALMLAMPAFAAVQNVKVSGDITTYGVSQSDFDFNDSSDSESYVGSQSDEGFITTITRLRVDADLTDNVSATVRFLSELDWGNEDSTYNDNETVSIDLSYLTLKEMFYSPLTLIIGRQDLRYGSALVVGDPDTNATETSAGLNSSAAFLSKRKAFDAIRGILDYDPLTIDLVYAKIDEVYEGGTDSEDRDLLGVNLAYKFADYNAEAEAYAFYVDGNNSHQTGSADAGNDIAVLGLRGSLVPVDGLTLGGEIAWQTGDYNATRDQDAWAGTAEGSYKWNNQYEPTIKLCYDYRSGEESGNSGDYEAWNPLFEDQTKGLIADYLFAGANGGVNSNASIINVGGSIKPIEDLTVSLDWFNYTLVEDFGTSTSHSWSNAKSSATLKANEDNLGDEIDLALTYDYSEDVVIGLQAGWFMPGDIFDSANDDDAMEVIGSIAVSF